MAANRFLLFSFSKYIAVCRILWPFIWQTIDWHPHQAGVKGRKFELGERLVAQTIKHDDARTSVGRH